MKLIIGLGNPVPQYAKTRHNLGRRVVEALSNTGWERSRKLLADTSHWEADRERAVLALPLTFMNESGAAVRKLAKFHRIKPDALLVVHDDADLAFGKIRLSYGSRSAGHRGVESVIAALKTKKFWRLRLGIRPLDEPIRQKADELILQPFTAHEDETLTGTIIPHAVEIVRAWIENNAMP